MSAVDEPIKRAHLRGQQEAQYDLLKNKLTMIIERLRDLEVRLNERGNDPYLDASANGEEYLQFATIVALLIRDAEQD